MNIPIFIHLRTSYTLTTCSARSTTYICRVGTGRVGLLFYWSAIIQQISSYTYLHHPTLISTHKYGSKQKEKHIKTLFRASFVLVYHLYVWLIHTKPSTQYTERVVRGRVQAFHRTTSHGIRSCHCPLYSMRVRKDILIKCNKNKSLLVLTCYIGLNVAPLRQGEVVQPFYTSSPQNARNYQIKNLQTSFHKWRRREFFTFISPRCDLGATPSHCCCIYHEMENTIVVVT